MDTPVRSIAMILVAAFLGSIGQYLYKEGARLPMHTITSWLTNWWIIIGMVCYIAVMGLFIAAFKTGGELTILYPMYGSTFIWALLIGKTLLDESIGPSKIAGIGIIIVGMYFVAR